MEMAQAVTNQRTHTQENPSHQLEDIPFGRGAASRAPAVQRDGHGRMEQEASKHYLAF